jgi:hypothetical protein
VKTINRLICVYDDCGFGCASLQVDNKTHPVPAVRKADHMGSDWNNEKEIYRRDKDDYDEIQPRGRLSHTK